MVQKKGAGQAGGQPTHTGATKVEITNKGLHFTALSDLLAEPDEKTPWLVDDLLPQAGLSIISARPKSGKSTLARSLTLAVARGERFLDRQTTAGTVLYLALEEKRAELRRQFRAMGATDEPIQFYCATAPGDGVALLIEAVMRDMPALVIVDPIIRMARMVDSNSYSEASRALEPFIAMARESGAHVMLVHHSGRGDRQGVDAPMGSTAFAGSVDTILNMRRNDRMRTLSSVQRYGTDLDEVLLNMDEAGRISAGGTKREHDEGAARNSIRAFLEAHPDSDQQAIKEGVEGRWSIVRPALTAMAKAGMLSKKGTGKRGDPHLYSLAFDTIETAEKEAQEKGGFLVPGIYAEPENQKRNSGLSNCKIGGYSGSRDCAFLGVSGNQKKETGNQQRENEDDLEIFEVGA